MLKKLNLKWGFMSASTVTSNKCCYVSKAFKQVCSSVKSGASCLNKKVQNVWAQRAQLPGAGIASWASRKVEVGCSYLPSCATVKAKAAEFKNRVIEVFKGIFDVAQRLGQDFHARFFARKS